MSSGLQPYRVSGHESFPCRYTWLPKAVRGLEANPRLFSDEDQAMLDLGLGKNMVRSVRFWAQACGMIAPISRSGGCRPSELGSAVLGLRGHDPFLEETGTLWLIHWQLSTNVQSPLLAWDFLLNNWQVPELVPSTVVQALSKETMRRDMGLSRATIEQHFETFLHTYVPTRGKKGEVLEDNLDCPLVELELIIKTGERPADAGSGRGESIYAFRREPKPDISGGLFLYCLNHFWTSRHSAEKTLSFREVAHGHGSPGQVFKLPEEDIAERLDGLAAQTDGALVYSPSADLQLIHRHKEMNDAALLKEIYAGVEVAA